MNPPRMHWGNKFLCCIPNCVLLLFTFSMYCSCPYKVGTIACNIHVVCMQLGFTTSSVIATSVIGLCSLASSVNVMYFPLCRGLWVRKSCWLAYYKNTSAVGHPDTFGILHLTFNRILPVNVVSLPMML